MSRFTKQITSYWQQFRTVVRNEYGSIFTDAGVILVLVLALLIYSTLYSLAYGTQVLRNVPIGVIDMSNTSTSRQTRTVDHAVTLVFDPGSDAQRSFRTPRSDARMALPVRPDSAEQQRGRRVHPAPKYGGFVQRRVARGTYPVDSHDSLRRIRCCRHTPSPQEGRR